MGHTMPVSCAYARARGPRSNVTTTMRTFEFLKRRFVMLQLQHMPTARQSSQVPMEDQQQPVPVVSHRGGGDDPPHPAVQMAPPDHQRVRSLGLIHYLVHRPFNESGRVHHRAWS